MENTFEQEVLAPAATEEHDAENEVTGENHSHITDENEGETEEHDEDVEEGEYDEDMQETDEETEDADEAEEA